MVIPECGEKWKVWETTSWSKLWRGNFSCSTSRDEREDASIKSVTIFFFTISLIRLKTLNENSPPSLSNRVGRGGKLQMGVFLLLLFNDSRAHCTFSISSPKHATLANGYFLLRVHCSTSISNVHKSKSWLRITWTYSTCYEGFSCLFSSFLLLV